MTGALNIPFLLLQPPQWMSKHKVTAREGFGNDSSSSLLKSAIFTFCFYFRVILTSRILRVPCRWRERERERWRWRSVTLCVQGYIWAKKFEGETEECCTYGLPWLPKGVDVGGGCTPSCTEHRKLEHSFIFLFTISNTFDHK